MDINKEELSQETLVYIDELKSQNKNLQNKVEDLTHKLDLMIIEKFWKSSEKISALQPEPFEELTVQELEDILEEISVPGKSSPIFNSME